MAGKRVATTSINWAAFAERVSQQEMPNYLALKAKNDLYTRRVAANPDSLQKIDWNHYKSKISIPGLVESFQKSYETLTIPYPSDQGLIAKIDEQESEMKKSLAEFSKQCEERKAEMKKKLEALEAELPYSEMTIEEYCIANPKVAFDFDNPTFYPHDERARQERERIKKTGSLL